MIILFGNNSVYNLATLMNTRVKQYLQFTQKRSIKRTQNLLMWERSLHELLCGILCKNNTSYNLHYIFFDSKIGINLVN